MRAAAWLPLLAALPALAAADAPFDAPGFPRTSELAPDRAAGEPAPRPFALRAYDALSRFDGPRCPHRPSCSAYAAQAFRARGPALGAALTAARLFRGDRSSGLRLLPRDAEGRLLDPLEESTFFLAAADPAAPRGPASDPQTAVHPERSDDAEAEERSRRAGAETLRFADWLLERGDLYRAIGEYERYLFLAPGGPEAGRAELQIARAYARGGEADASAAALLRLERGSPELAIREAALFERGLVRYRARDAARAIAPLAAYAALPAPSAGPGPGRARLLLALARLRAGEAAAADRELDLAAAADPALAPAARDLREAAREVARAPARSPVAAGLLSAVVPGLGHVYAGDPAAGAIALALNGAFAWATVEAFRDHRPGLGVVLASAESIWYAGAIYGAVAEAMRYRRDAREAALDRIDRRFRWVVEVGPVPGGAAAAVRGEL